MKILFFIMPLVFLASCGGHENEKIKLLDNDAKKNNKLLTPPCIK
jgi:hypothetical protein